MKVGIVGHGKDKFNPNTEKQSKRIIREIIGNSISAKYRTTIVSGHSPVGGIDIWAEEIATDWMRYETNLSFHAFAPKQHSWDGEYGFKARNLDIAKSDEVHVILVKEYPEDYKGRKFDTCYHCERYFPRYPPHVKSGGCWTGWKAREAGKDVFWHIIGDREVLHYNMGWIKDV